MQLLHRPTLAAATLLAAAGLALSCDDGNGGGTGTEDPATISATVTADGSNRSGVTVLLFEPGGTTATSTATTGSNGVATFSNLDAGSYEVEIQVPAGFDLGSNEQGRKPVSVMAGQTADVPFSLVSLQSGGTVEISLTTNNTFSNPNVTITAGTTVRWTNDIDRFHTITPDGHTEWQRVTMNQAGDTFSHTFNTAGTFDYFCEPHVDLGMTGTITVQ